MNVDLEKLRNELKNKIDEVIDGYAINDNAIIEIPDENIYMEFELNDQDYIAFTENNIDDEEFEMMFAKVEIIDGKRILRNIEDKDEYTQIVNEFNKRIELMSDN